MAQNASAARGRSKSPSRSSKPRRTSKSPARSPIRRRGGKSNSIGGAKNAMSLLVSPRTTPSRRNSSKTRRSDAEEQIDISTAFWTKALPCICYASSSIYMTLAQKYVVMSLKEVKSIFLFYQNAAALLLFIPSSLGWLGKYGIQQYAFWDSKMALEVLPLGVTYSIMLYTSNWALSVLTVPMVSVLKNLGPILITVTECYTDDRPLSTGTLVSMLMLVVGSMVAGYNDLRYDTVGYIAIGLNVLTNLLHVQFTKRLQRGGKVKKHVALHYQSIFMCIFLLPVMWREDLAGIFVRLFHQRVEILVVFMSTGLNGIIIALCTMWCIEATSGSTYSMVGALNKVPSSILGTIIFQDPIDVLNMLGVAIGLAGGLVFTVSQVRQL